jgi:hypothetical protein
MADSKRFTVWSRLQDSGWGYTGSSYDTAADALLDAGEKSLQSIYYGMTAVRDEALDAIVQQFPGGYPASQPEAQRAMMMLKVMEGLEKANGRPNAPNTRVLEHSTAVGERNPPERSLPGKPVEPAPSLAPGHASGGAVTPDVALAAKVREFAAQIGQAHKGLESVSVTFCWEKGAGDLLGGWSAPDGAGLPQAGAYRLVHVIQQMEEQLALYKQLLHEELQALNCLVYGPNQHAKQTTGSGTQTTGTTGGSMGTGASGGCDVFPRLYDPGDDGVSYLDPIEAGWHDLDQTPEPQRGGGQQESRQEDPQAPQTT